METVYNQRMERRTTIAIALEILIRRPRDPDISRVLVQAVPQGPSRIPWVGSSPPRHE